MTKASPQSSKKPFNNSAAPIAGKKSKAPAPFSLRLTVEERKRLEVAAGNRPLGAYIRHKLLGDTQTERKYKRRAPAIDYVLLGKILAVLGKSELAANMCILATAAEIGSLAVDDELTSDLKSACDDIRLLRVSLIKALGIKPEDRS